MAERRTLGQALTLTPEKNNFIRDVESESHKAKPDVTSLGGQSVISGPNHVDVAATEAPTRELQTNYVQPNQPQAYEPTLVSVTTRLRPETASALRRAYLEQKLARRTPDTQQEIIEDALQHWLYERGFLR